MNLRSSILLALLVLIMLSVPDRWTVDDVHESRSSGYRAGHVDGKQQTKLNAIDCVEDNHNDEDMIVDCIRGL